MKVPMVTTESGLQYKDIKVGSGPTPPVGYQVWCLHWKLKKSGQYAVLRPGESFIHDFPYIYA